MKTNLIEFLRENFDLFAWVTLDMPVIDPNFMCYQLFIHPNVFPVTQKKQKMSLDRAKAVEVQVDSLLKAGFI